MSFLLLVGMTESVVGQMGMNVSGGLNYSNCKFVHVDRLSTSSRVGYFIGVAPSYRISKRIKVQTDIQYSLKGYDTNEQIFVSGSKSRFGYIDIIPEVEYAVLNFLSLGLGVNYGIKVLEQHKIGNQEWFTSDEIETVSSTDFGLTGKLKVDFNKMFAFVRYNLGLMDIAEFNFTDDNGERIEDAEQLNRNLQVGIGYRFGNDSK